MTDRALGISAAVVIAAVLQLQPVARAAATPEPTAATWGYYVFQDVKVCLPAVGGRGEPTVPPTVKYLTRHYLAGRMSGGAYVAAMQKYNSRYVDAALCVVEAATSRA